LSEDVRDNRSSDSDALHQDIHYYEKKTKDIFSRDEIFNQNLNKSKAELQSIMAEHDRMKYGPGYFDSYTDTVHPNKFKQTQNNTKITNIRQNLFTGPDTRGVTGSSLGYAPNTTNFYNASGQKVRYDNQSKIGDSQYTYTQNMPLY
jgi:hypothetical protein